jgi:hypothetical protein
MSYVTYPVRERVKDLTHDSVYYMYLHCIMLYIFFSSGQIKNKPCEEVTSSAFILGPGVAWLNKFVSYIFIFLINKGVCWHCLYMAY